MLVARIREWRHNRRRQPGLNSVLDAAKFVARLKSPVPVVPEPVEVPLEPVRTVLDMRTPIYDELWRETAARMTRERVAAIFAEMVADWRCESCTAGEHQWCPACTCPCSLVAPEGVS